jgi:transglutaminase-like putative cysteine protease
MRRVGLFRAIIFLAFIALPAGASDVPQWLAAAARLALPTHSPETEAVVLLAERQITLDQSGTIHVSCHRAVKVLRHGGLEEARRLVLVSAYDTKIRSMTGWNMTEGRKTLKVTMKNVVEAGLAPDTLYTDVSMKILIVPSAEVGSVVGFEWEEERRPESLEDIFEFQGRFPVGVSRYAVVLPPGWTMETFWVNWTPMEGRPVVGPPSAVIWKTADIPAIEEEPLMPSPRALAGRVIVRFRASQPDSRCFSAWADIGAWYEALSKECRAPDRAIELGAQELVAPAPDTLSRMRVLAEFVQKKVRYVAIEIGIGGYKPHSAGSVLANRYGDCKDKATLLAALLQASGVDSYYLIVNTDNGTVIPGSPPSLYCFNHVVLAIRLPEDVAGTDFPAVVRHPRLGRLLVFDPTSPYTPMGQLPVYLQGNTALLVAERSGELISLPLPRPESNLLDRRGRFVLGADGTLEGEIEEVRRGAAADATRHALMNSTDLERTKYIETFLANFCAGSSLQSSEIRNLYENSDDLAFRYRFRVPNYARPAGEMMIVRPRVVGDKRERLETNDDRPRRYAIDLNAVSEQRDEFTIELAEGFRVDSLPPAADIDSGFAVYRSRTEERNRTLVYHRVYRLTQPVLPAVRYDEAVRFFRAVDADQRQSVLLKRSS